LTLAISALLALPLWAGDKKPAKAPKPVKLEKASETPKAAGLPSYEPSTAPVTTALVFEKIEALDKSLTSLAAHYKQTVKLEEGDSGQSVEGRVAYLKPNRLRIEHQKPEKQSVISDGKKVWVWRQETNQVIGMDLEDWKRSEPMLQNLMEFGSYGAFLRKYDVSVATVSAPGADGHKKVTLKLKPREPSSDFSLLLTLSTKDWFPGETVLRVGQVDVKTSFDDIQYNPELPAKSFDFKVPPGADYFPNFKPPTIK
jgi:outer membrane lipoprotein carrier protein